MLLAGPRLLGGFHHYLRAYRRLTRARLVVSRTDNNLAIWRIKRRRNSNFMVLLIQNGWAWTSRGLPSRELLTWPKQLFVDRLALFGRHAEVMTVGHPSRGGIRSLVCGSLILNEFIREKPQATGCATVAILSTFRVKTVTLPDRTLIQTEQSSGAQEYERLESVLRRRGLSARVYCCGRAKALEAEKRFFQAHLRDPGLQFVERHRFDDSYRSLIKEQIVVSDVSTLGFEALGIGIRTGFINFPEHWQQPRFAFGWPLEFGEKGPFWTDDPSEAEIERILDYLLSVSDEQWERDSGWIRDQLIVHDYGNTILKRYVEGVLAGKGDVLAEEAGGGRG
jgi:surface carbohydrate biosynthesis protein